jgi:hypothetical protein
MATLGAVVWREYPHFSEGPGREAPSDRGPAQAEGFGGPSLVRPVAIKPAISGLTAAAKRRFLADCRMIATAQKRTLDAVKACPCERAI